MNPKPCLMLLASAHSYRFAIFEQAAERLGAEAVRGEDVPRPILEKANVPLALDYNDIPFSTRLIKKYALQKPVKALVGLDDSGTLLAAAASELLGLPHNPPSAALAARNKFLMRQRFAAEGVPSPAFHRFFLTDDPAEIAARTRYPCVLKPTSLAGSRGVMRADTPDEFLQRYARIRRILETEGCDQFLVEDYLPGVEVALEGLLENGKLRLLALFDKPDLLEGPFFEETIYITPSRLPAEIQAAIFEVASRAAAALGLWHGPVHAELRVKLPERSGKLEGSGSKVIPDAGQGATFEGPWMVEMAARSIGGACSQTLRFGTDLSLEEMILRQALGMEIPPTDRTGIAGGVMMIPIPESGILMRVAGVAEAEKVRLIDGVEIAARLNYPLQVLPEGDSYLGFIFAHGETPAAVEAALREAHSKLQIEITPQIPLSIS